MLATRTVRTLICLAAATMTAQTLADTCVSPTPEIPPPCAYSAPQGPVPMDVFPGAQLLIEPTLQMQLEGVVPGGLLGGEVSFFQGDLQLQMVGVGELDGYVRTMIVPVGGEIHSGPRDLSAPVQDFPTEMFVLQGQLFGDPDFDQFSVQAGGGTGLPPSPGQTTLTALPNGNFNVDSFFDIAYQINFQGSPTGPLAGAGGGAILPVQQQAGCPPMPDDCNNNGVPDDIDVASGSSYDSNNNGVPDECEANAEVRQLSWTDGQGGFAQRFSDFGEFAVTLPQPPKHEIAWLNVNVDNRWVVQNMPMLAMDRADGALHTYSVRFDLANQLGLPDPFVDMGFSVTPDQVPLMPPVFAPDFPVVEQPASIGSFSEVDWNTIPAIPFGPTDFINPFLPALWETVTREGVPGVEEDKNGCAPGSGARCLSWLNDQYCLGFPADCTDPQAIYNSLFGSMGTTTANGSSKDGIINGLNNFINGKGLAGSLSVAWNQGESPNDAFDDLAAGKDVLGLLRYNVDGRSWGHVITLTGMTRCPATTTINYRDDNGQDNDDKGDDGTKSGKYDSTDGSVSGFGEGASWYGTVTICPSPLTQIAAIAKELFGTGGQPAPGGGPPIESLEDILQRIADGTASDADIAEALKRICKATEITCQLIANLLKEDPLRTSLILKVMELKNALLDLKITLLEQLIASNPELIAAMFAHYDTAGTATTDAFSSADCNANGMDDTIDLAVGNDTDDNLNGVLDGCECVCDRDGNGAVDIFDLLDYLSAYFVSDASAEMTGDNPASIDVGDLLNFLSCWFPASDGAACP